MMVSRISSFYMPNTNHTANNEGIADNRASAAPAVFNGLPMNNAPLSTEARTGYSTYPHGSTYKNIYQPSEISQPNPTFRSYENQQYPYYVYNSSATSNINTHETITSTPNSSFHVPQSYVDVTHSRQHPASPIQVYQPSIPSPPSVSISTPTATPVSVRSMYTQSHGPSRTINSPQISNNNTISSNEVDSINTGEHSTGQNDASRISVAKGVSNSLNLVQYTNVQPSQQSLVNNTTAVQVYPNFPKYPSYGNYLFSNVQQQQQQQQQQLPLSMTCQMSSLNPSDPMNSLNNVNLSPNFYSSVSSYNNSTYGNIPYNNPSYSSPQYGNTSYTVVPYNNLGRAITGNITGKKVTALNESKRKRRKYCEIKRHYKCNFADCTKAYGTLNHLNFHIHLQNHGPKRTPAEFKHLNKKTGKDV